jgi:endonuclease-3 related protein
VLTRWRRIPGPGRDAAKARLLRLYQALLGRFGPQGWWPGRTPFEIAIGAILTQHTAWTNAARAIEALRAARLLTPSRVAGTRDARLATVIRAAGTYRQKARTVHAFARWLVERHGGHFDGLRTAPLGTIRAELLGIPGLGPETADAILLYAAHRPVFVADAYARRALARRGFLPQGASYEHARAFLEAHLPSDPALFNEFHALLVALGKSERQLAMRTHPGASRLTATPRSRPRAGRPRRGSRARAPARPSS